MPSQEHELLAEMFQARPELAVDVLELLGLPVPAFDDAVVASAELNNVVPTEYRADRVVEYTVNRRPVFAVIVEVQLKADRRKRFAWPAYVGTLYGRLKCPLLLLVVCRTAAAATWCGEPVVITDPDFFRLKPIVLGPRQVPVVTDVATAERNPQLALLSAILHADEPEPVRRMEAAAAAIIKIKNDLGELYHDPLLAVLPQAHRALLKEIVMAVGFKGEFARHHEAVGEARTILMVLTARGVEVPDDVRTRIATCTDVDQLDAWVQRSATATKISDLFD